MFGRELHDSPLGRTRLFERGELRYAVLDVLASKPRHGYDVLLALAERYSPFYTPSAGTVYPTLQLLEDAGAVRATMVDGKKVYTLTATGQERLAEHRATLEAIRARFSMVGDPAARGELGEAMHEVRALGRLLFQSRRQALSTEQRSRIRATLRRAREELEATLASPATTLS
jgi:DNA-binding PadR family transcriptional regulator